MSPSRNVLVYGGGAVGSILGWRIAQCRNTLVSVVCRSNFDQVKDNGFLIHTNTWGDGRFRPHHVFRAGRLSEMKCHHHFDYIVCANKVTVDSDSVIEDIQPLVRPDTTLVTAQNGMDVEKPLREEFSKNTILSAVCNIGINQQYPGIIKQTARIRKKAFLIGIPGASPRGLESDRQQRDEFSAMDHEFASVTSALDMQKERWTKLIFNVAWNSVTAILGLNTHQVLCRPDAVVIVRELANEAYAVAVRSGVELDEDVPNRTVELAKGSAPITPSTLQDVNKQRPMELGPIFGYLVAQARKVDMHVPCLTMIYDRLQQKNSRILSQCSALDVSIRTQPRVGGSSLDPSLDLVPVLHPHTQANLQYF